MEAFPRSEAGHRDMLDVSQRNGVARMGVVRVEYDVTGDDSQCDVPRYHRTAAEASERRQDDVAERCG